MNTDISKTAQGGRKKTGKSNEIKFDLLKDIEGIYLIL